MFNFVHHVRFLVHDRDAMVEYIQHTFGMKPDRLQVYEQRGMKNAIYKVGPTSFEITEPLDADSAMGKYLAQQGPGVYHLAWGIDNLQQVAIGKRKVSREIEAMHKAALYRGALVLVINRYVVVMVRSQAFNTGDR